MEENYNYTKPLNPAFQHQSAKEDDDPILEFQMLPTDLIMSKRFYLLGIPFIGANSHELISHCIGVLENVRAAKQGGAQHIMPIDPYIFMTLKYRKTYRAISQSAFINLPAAKGIRWIARFFKFDLPEIIPASQFVLNLFRVAQAKEYTVFFIGSDSKALEKLQVNFTRSFPRLRITGKHHGHLKGAAKEKVVAALQKTDPHIILLSLGFRKEMAWIRENKEYLKNCLLINLNGALDIMAGRKKRAPDFIEKAHMTWFWQSINRPYHWYRLLAILFFYIHLFVLRIFNKKKYVRSDS